MYSALLVVSKALTFQYSLHNVQRSYFLSGSFLCFLCLIVHPPPISDTFKALLRFNPFIFELCFGFIESATAVHAIEIFQCHAGSAAILVDICKTICFYHFYTSLFIKLLIFERIEICSLRESIFAHSRKPIFICGLHSQKFVQLSRRHCWSVCRCHT